MSVELLPVVSEPGKFTTKHGRNGFGWSRQAEEEFFKFRTKPSGSAFKETAHSL